MAVLERLPLGPKGRHAYFVHSYHLNAANEADVLARADYGGPVTAIVGKDTAVGTQFHPEKSQRFGLALIGSESFDDYSSRITKMILRCRKA